MTASPRRAGAIGDDRPTLLVLGSGDRGYREYALAAIAARYRLVLLDRGELGWERAYVVEHVRTPFTAEHVMPLVRRLGASHELVGVFTYDETAVELASLVATEHGLPGIDPACARRCRDKLEMRRALEAAGVPSATSRLVMSEAEASAAAEEIGYPVVVKPRSLAGSIAVVRVDGAAGIAAAYRNACAAGHPKFEHMAGALVEEYLDGPEYSVESIVVDGEARIVAVTEKHLGMAPHFEELGHTVCASDPVWRDARLRSVTAQAHRALGIHTGATHAELRMTATGPRMIEVAARLAGDMIGHLVTLATGVDMSAGAADVAAGAAPDLEPTLARAAAVRLLYPPADARVRSLGMAPEALEHPWLDRVFWIAAAGDELRLPPRGFMSRLGCIVVTGDDGAACRDRLAQVEALARIELAALPAG